MKAKTMERPIPGVMIRLRRKWMMALAIMTGMICLLVAGVFLYICYEQKAVTEYDGVLVMKPEHTCRYEVNL